jgi:hypothetical protein
MSCEAGRPVAATAASMADRVDKSPQKLIIILKIDLITGEIWGKKGQHCYQLLPPQAISGPRRSPPGGRRGVLAAPKTASAAPRSVLLRPLRRAKFQQFRAFVPSVPTECSDRGSKLPAACFVLSLWLALARALPTPRPGFTSRVPSPSNLIAPHPIRFPKVKAPPARSHQSCLFSASMADATATIAIS